MILTKRLVVFAIGLPTSAIVAYFLFATLFSGVIFSTVLPVHDLEATADWSDLIDSENASGVDVEFQTQWQAAQAASINVGHLFEGEPLKVRSRLRAGEAIGQTPLPPNGGCFYRPTSALHTEAVIVRWLFSATYAGTSHNYDGAIFLRNISEPDRSTIIPNGSGKNSVPPDFEKIDDNDPKCSAAVEFFKEFINAVNIIVGNGPWPGLPLT